MRDMVPKLKKGHSCIINLDSSDGGGTHWVALKDNGSHLQYFDSFGLQPPEEIKGGKKIQFNTSQLQDLKSSRCGFYCLYVLNELSKGKDYYDIIYSLDQMNQKKNEKAMENYFS